MPQIEVPLAAGKNRCKASYADEPVQKGVGEESRFGNRRFYSNAQSRSVPRCDAPNKVDPLLQASSVAQRSFP